MTEAWDRVWPRAVRIEGNGQAIVRWAGLGLASCLDQAAVSGTSFAVNVLLARWLPPAQYGAFSVAFALFLLVSGFHNALVVDPACVLGPARFSAELPRYFQRLVVVHGAWCVAASLVVAGAALATPGVMLRQAFYGLAIALPFLLLLWLVRRLCYVQGRPAAALVSSVAQTPFAIGGMYGLRHWGTPSPLTAFLVMAAASLAASAIIWSGLGLARGWTGVGRQSCVALARAHWSYGRWLTVTSWLTLGVMQLQTFLIAGFVGLEKAGAFRAMFNLVQPMNQVIVAAALLFQPNMSADFAAGRTEGLRAKGALITAGLVGLSAAYELVLVFFGGGLAHLLYGVRFSAYQWLIPILGLMPTLVALGTGRSLVLQAVQKPQHHLIRGLVTGPAGILSAVALTSWAGLGGAAASTVLTLAVSALMTTWLYRHYALGERRIGT
jgi:O-antigen/teichoic acid export membrane protein